MKGSISNVTLISQPNAQTLEDSFALYRCEILLQKIRWKARDEIYKIYMLLHRSDINQYFDKISSNFFAFFGKILQNSVMFE